MVGSGEPSYTKSLTQTQHKRFLLTQQGDSSKNMDSLIQEYDSS